MNFKKKCHPLGMGDQYWKFSNKCAFKKQMLCNLKSKKRVTKVAINVQLTE